MEQKIVDMIQEAEMVLVGIGEEFTPVLPEYTGSRDGSLCEKQLLPGASG